ncbi:MAG: hypothetical protein U0325_31675 [Polyangiales bacterium]
MTLMIDRIASLQDYGQYRDLHWEGSFEDYLQIVRAARRDAQRVSAAQGHGHRRGHRGVSRQQEACLVKYKFFQDERRHATRCTGSTSR